MQPPETEHSFGRPCHVSTAGTVESRFGVHRCRSNGAQRLAAIDPGPQTRGPNGVLGAGPLAVTLDHLLGEVLFEQRPERTWSVTSELSINLRTSLPPAGILIARSIDHSTDPTGGFATGTIQDSTGRILATGTTRTRIVPLSGAAQPPSSAPALTRPAQNEAAGLVGLLGVEVARSSAEAEVTMSTAEWGNLLGTVHGGVWACLADIAATAALPDELTLSLGSLHLIYGRAAHAQDGWVAVAARVARQGRTSATIEISGSDKAGRECIRGFATALSWT